MKKGNQIYIISDSHFGHSKMEEWALRPADFEQKIWKGLDSLPCESILIHLGDLSLGADHEVAEKFRQYCFKTWLIRGNHDHHSISWYIDNGWDMVCEELVLEIFGHRILLSHTPLPKREGITKNIHGHLHGGKSHSRPDFYDKNYHFEVCPEVIGYLPAKLGSL